MYVTVQIHQDDLARLREVVQELRAERVKVRRANRCHRLFKQFWNSRLDWLNSRITADKDQPGQAQFFWVQLVGQELSMWATIADPVSRKDFNYLCKRRGFNKAQRRFLSEGLTFMGLKVW